MKISEIVISNYRAFYNERGEETTKYRINLGHGKNLLVYGENGSGKSSFYKGLRDFFRSAVEPDYPVLQNVFSREIELDEQPFIEVTFSEEGQENRTFRFSADPHQTNTDDDIIKSVVRSRSFMTYRDLLRVHFVDHPDVNLFDFLFGEDGLLAELPNPVHSRPETNLKMSSLFQAVREKPDEINIKDFTDGVNQILKDLNKSLNCLLKYFDKSLSVTFSVLSEESVKEGQPVIKTDVIYFGINLSEEKEQYHHFLNEARLSALAICIFLAAHLSVPSAAYDILFLDDIFTGLDTSNRIPLLNILSDEIIEGTESDTFSDHQILLTTYDREWYELAKNHLGSRAWNFQEMYIDRHSKGFDHPAILPGEDNFDKARYYFRMKQYPACANYQRKICENLIKQFLPDHKKYDALPNGDIKPVDKLATLIDRFEGYLVENGLDPSPYKELKICLRAFMNPLSHDDGVSPAYRKELELGFSLLEKLQKLKNREVIPQGGIIQTTQIHGESGIPYFYEFEVQTSLRLLTTETEKKLSKLLIRPLKMIKLDDNEEKIMGYKPELIEKGFTSICKFLKITEELQPLEQFLWKNGDVYEQLSTILDD